MICLGVVLSHQAQEMGHCEGEMICLGVVLSHQAQEMGHCEGEMICLGVVLSHQAQGGQPTRRVTTTVEEADTLLSSQRPGRRRVPQVCGGQKRLCHVQCQRR